MNWRGEAITKPVKPTDVRIFYENGEPFIQYRGVTKLDSGITVEVEIPKMGLELKEIEVNANEMYSTAIPYTTRYKQEVYVVNGCQARIRPIERTCTKEELEKELGYKLNLK